MADAAAQLDARLDIAQVGRQRRGGMDWPSAEAKGVAFLN